MIESDLIVLPLIIFQYNLIFLCNDKNVNKFSDKCLQPILVFITAKIHYINKERESVLIYFVILHLIHFKNQ